MTFSKYLKIRTKEIFAMIWSKQQTTVYVGHF